MNKSSKTGMWVLAALAVIVVGVLLFPSIRSHLPSFNGGDSSRPDADVRNEGFASEHQSPPPEPQALPASPVAGGRSTPGTPARRALSDDQVSTARTQPATPDPNDDRVAALGLARELVSGLPVGTRLALRPLGRRADNLPPDVGRRLYEALLGGISRAAPADITLMARERLAEVYRSLEEFYQGDIESLLRNARADVEIICGSTWDARGILLSCSAIRLESGVTLASGSAHFEHRRDGADYELAINDVARRIVDGAPGPGRIARTLFQDAKTGAQTDLGQDAGRRLDTLVAAELAGLADRRANVARAADVLGGAPGTVGVAEYRLRGLLRALDANRIRLDARLEDASGTTLVSAGADVAVSTIPEVLRPGPSASATRSRRHEAIAEAVVSSRLDAASARRAVRNLARARVIAQAMALAAPDVTEITDEVDAMRALGEYLGIGITVGEEFHDVPGRQAPGRVVVRLVAQVVPVGTAVRPPVSAKLGKSVYAEHEPMTLEIRSEAAAHVGVFSWAADNTVVRLYPNLGRTSLAVGADDVVILPGAGEGRLMSSPMPPPSNLEDHEAVVVVASANRMDFMALAPSVGATLDETMGRSINGSDFLHNVASAQPGQMAVLVLPYLVHR